MPAARRRLPMVELDATVEVVGPDGPVPPPRAAMDPPRRDPVDTLAGTDHHHQRASRWDTFPPMPMSS